MRMRALVCCSLVVVLAISPATADAAAGDRDRSGSTPSQTTLAKSRFTQDSEGWRVTGDPTSPEPTWVATGGNPGGFVQTVDRGQGGYMYWDAPPKFLGDKVTAFRGSVRFDLRQSETGRELNEPGVMLEGAGHTLTRDLTYAPYETPVWTSYRVSLNRGLWLDGGEPATKNDMRAVLGALDSLQILAEYSTQRDVDDLDNVVLKAGKRAPR